MVKKRRKSEDSPAKSGLQPGLYLVATPIGNAKDITLRALEVLQAAGTIFCEDTRVTQKLLSLHGITGKKLLSAHAHNELQSAESAAAKIREGEVVAYASDAGLPLISDPGQVIVKKAIAEGLPVVSLPGANAALTALQLSGLAAQKFTFIGFLPQKSSARRRALQPLKNAETTLIFYEAPHRILEMLSDLLAVLGNRPASLSRELTKLHEETLRGTLESIHAGLRKRESLKGEMVVIVGSGEENEEPLDQTELDRLLLEARKTLSARDAAAIMSGRTGLPKRELYQRLLHLHDESPRRK